MVMCWSGEFPSLGRRDTGRETHHQPVTVMSNPASGRVRLLLHLLLYCFSHFLSCIRMKSLSSLGRIPVSILGSDVGRVSFFWKLWGTIFQWEAVSKLLV